MPSWEDTTRLYYKIFWIMQNCGAKTQIWSPRKERGELYKTFSIILHLSDCWLCTEACTYNEWSIFQPRGENPLAMPPKCQAVTRRFDRKVADAKPWRRAWDWTTRQRDTISLHLVSTPPLERKRQPALRISESRQWKALMWVIL